ncbi:MAG: very short patch repair endonuclease [Blastocatellia bacterium]|nr:very short patch repair endonuclease [Blastocatellia bacterium]
MDNLTPEQRSRQMSLVRSKNTKPELFVRKLVFSLGFRYRLHYRRVPGKPDLAFPGKKKVVFVHGCFWHRHEECKLARIPKSRIAFWKEKLERNRDRDQENQRAITALGWKSLVIWECEIGNVARVTKKLKRFLQEKSGWH